MAFILLLDAALGKLMTLELTHSFAIGPLRICTWCGLTQHGTCLLKKLIRTVFHSKILSW